MLCELHDAGRIPWKRTYEVSWRLRCSFPVNDRLEIASQLLDTVTPDDDVLHLRRSVTDRELDRRFADREESIPWNELRGEAY